MMARMTQLGPRGPSPAQRGTRGRGPWQAGPKEQAELVLGVLDVLAFEDQCRSHWGLGFLVESPALVVPAACPCSCPGGAPCRVLHAHTHAGLWEDYGDSWPGPGAGGVGGCVQARTSRPPAPAWPPLALQTWWVWGIPGNLGARGLPEWSQMALFSAI